MNAISIDNLCRRFGGRTVVDHLTLDIAQGEIFALLGQNGAGKTTTIRMLSCLLPPDDGDARVLGDSIRSAPDAVKAKINLSPQQNAVARNLTVRENLELFAKLWGADRSNAREAAGRAMADFGLTDRADERAKTLSGGLERRLSIAMALISRPQVLFLDEPTLGLDVRARRDLWRMIESLRGKMTIVLTTHYLEEAEYLADRIGVMQDGRLCALGSVETLCTETGTSRLEDAFLALTESGEVEK
ncbi:MAG: ABC transporter ATP-binding protein [Clostridia bacterium]|nr:ABC transporter ATP-binding protein [Clostridia bacterium]